MLFDPFLATSDQILKQSCEKSITFIDKYPDRAYFNDTIIAGPDIEEQLDWIAAELRNAHFAAVFQDQIHQDETIDLRAMTRCFELFLKIKLGDAVSLLI